MRIRDRSGSVPRDDGASPRPRHQATPTRTRPPRSQPRGPRSLVLRARVRVHIAQSVCMRADPNKPKPRFVSPRGPSARKRRRRLHNKRKKIAAAAAAATLSFDKDEHEPAASAAAASLLGLAGAADPSQAADVDLSDGELRESQQLRDSDSKPEADEPLLEEALKRLRHDGSARGSVWRRLHLYRRQH